MKEQSLFFDKLKRNIEFLHKNPLRDNEASRHDLLIYPMITNIHGLEWEQIDIVSQSTINVPNEISESHIFRGAIPKIRKPDLLICPNEIVKNFAIIEEKKRQNNIEELNNHRIQLNEYQSLYECTWAMLTDGEKWIIKKGFDTYFEFNSIQELENNIKDFKKILSKKPVITKYNQYKSFDLIIVQQIINQPFPKYSNIPTIVVGVSQGLITDSGLGYKEFPTFQEALIDFPDLHPTLKTKRFTWGFTEKDTNNNIIKLRFESWQAYDFYSS